MTATTPRRVSVIVPTRDRTEFLRRALASIRALEGDAYSFEILIGDNGLTPETRTIAEEFGARYFKVEKIGCGAARNAPLANATGDYIAFLDDDDVWLPTHLKKHFEILDADPNAEAVIGQVIYTDYELNPLGLPFPESAPTGDDLWRRMLGGFYPQMGTLVTRRSVREKYGLFDDDLIGGHDHDWLLKIARQGTIRFANTPCVLFRGRPSGSYDELQMRRVKFDRKVFFRHAIPGWRMWRSPTEFEEAYRGSLSHFFQYFIEAAASRSESGDRLGALRAIYGAFRVFPLRATAHIVAHKPLGKAAISALSGR